MNSFVDVSIPLHFIGVLLFAQHVHRGYRVTRRKQGANIRWKSAVCPVHGRLCPGKNEEQRSAWGWASASISGEVATGSAPAEFCPPKLPGFSSESPQAGQPDVKRALAIHGGQPICL